MSEGPNRNNIKQYMPIQAPKQRYYTLEEVSHHNIANDCWIILFGEVYNLTSLVQNNIDSKLCYNNREIS